jgi:hypothetical protein
MAGIIGKYTVTKLQAPGHTASDLEIKLTPDISLTLKGPTIGCVNEVLTITQVKFVHRVVSTASKQ